MGIVILSGTSTDLANVANYSTGALPIAGDTLILRQRSADFTSNLSALAGIALAKFIAEATFTGSIGTAAAVTHMGIDADEVYWEAPAPLALLDFAATTCNFINITNTGQGASDGLESLRIKGTAIAAVYVLGGSVCIAGHRPTDTATITGITVGTASGASVPVARLGAGVTVTNLTVNNGYLANDGCSPSGAVKILGPSAVYIPQGSASHPGTVLISNGQLTDKTDGTITALTVSGGTYDASQDPRAKIITNCTISAGSILQLNNNITFTNAPALTGNTINIAA